MNVPLRRTLSSSEAQLGGESPNNLNKNPGFFVLFNTPHPSRWPNETNSDTISASAAVATINERPFGKTSMLSFMNIDDSGSSGSSESKYYFQNTLSSSITRMDSITASYGRQPLQSLDNMPPSNNSNINNGEAMVTKRYSYNPATVTGKKSLLRPVADSSLRSLRMAADIDLERDERCGVSISSMHDKSYALKFSAMFGSYLDPVYSYSNDRCGLNADVDNANRLSGKILWDADFEANLTELRSRLLDKSCVEVSNTADELLSDNMFAVGCMIAELYTGKPLLTPEDMKNINVAGDGKVDTLAKLAFGRTAVRVLYERSEFSILICVDRICLWC